MSRSSVPPPTLTPADVPSARQRTDLELTEHIRQAHQASRGLLRGTTDPRRAASPRPSACQEAGGKAAACRGPVRPDPAPLQADHDPDPAAAARADLVRRDFTVNAAAVTTRWCGDITHLPTWEGWLYLATVIDIASRRVVGFALAEHLRTDLDAVAAALNSRPRKTLGWRTPAETLNRQLLSIQRGGVATTP
jgi:putative transposase